MKKHTKVDMPLKKRNQTKQSFHQGTVKKPTVQHWIKKFCNEDGNLEDEDRRCPTLTDPNQLRSISEMNPWATTSEVEE